MIEKDPRKIEHLVVTIHGIRTYGGWQERLEMLIANSARSQNIKFAHYKFGFFSTPAFFFPPTRWFQARRFRRELERLVVIHPNLRRLDIFAHSFGTYVATRAIAGKPVHHELPMVNNLVLAGSVLERTHPWLNLIGSKVGRLVNEVGNHDYVLFLNQLFVPFLGSAGLLGFQTFELPEITQRYYNVGHSGYFQPRKDSADWFLRRFWVSIIQEPANNTVEPYRETEALTTIHGLRLFLLNNSTLFKATLAAIIVGSTFSYVLGLYDAAEEQRKLAVARLAASEATTIARSVDVPTKMLPDAGLLAVEAMERLVDAEKDGEAQEFLVKNALRIAPVFEAFRPIDTIKLDPSGSRLAIGWNNTVLIRQIIPANQSIQIDLGAFDNEIKEIGFSIDARFLFVILSRGLKVYDLQDQELIYHDDRVIKRMASDDSGQRLAYSTADGILAAVDLLAQQLYYTTPVDSQDFGFVKGSRLVFDDSSGRLAAVDATGTMNLVKNVSNGRIKSLLISNDQTRVAVLREQESSNNDAQIGIGSLEVFQADQWPLISIRIINEDVNAIEFLTKDALFLATEDGTVGTLRLNEQVLELDCNLMALQEETAIDGLEILDNQPPSLLSIVPVSYGTKAVLTTKSPYAPLRVLWYDSLSGDCGSLGRIDELVTDTRSVQEGKRLLLKLDDGSASIIDTERMEISPWQPAGWIDSIEASPNSNAIFFSKGPLVRGISLDISDAVMELCKKLGTRNLSSEKWRSVFGSEQQEPSCEGNTTGKLTVH